MNYERLASELLRALRGRRSQVAFSRRLGYRSNVAHAWETGVGYPSSARFFFVAQRVGLNPIQALRSRFGQNQDWLAGVDLSTKAGVAEMLTLFKGNQSILSLAKATGLDRFSLSRWLRGHNEPRLPDLLRFVEAATLRLLDFLAAFVDPGELSPVSAAWKAAELSRSASRDAPYCHAVLAALDLVDYRTLKRHEPGWIAHRLGLTGEAEVTALDLLKKTGQIERKGQLWTPVRAPTLDVRADQASARSLALFCAESGLAHLQNGGPGAFAFNLFSISNHDLDRIRNLQRAYFAELRKIVAQSEPAEQVVITNLQIAILGPKERSSP